MKNRKYGTFLDRSNSKEYRENLSKALKGNIPWNKGKKGIYKLSEETKQKISKALKGKKHKISKLNIEQKSKQMINKWKNKEYRNRMIKIIINSNINRRGEKRNVDFSGSNNPNWKNGKSFKWRQVRIKIFERDNYICQLCGKRGTYLNAHHIINRHFCKNIYNENNLITLCRNCHSYITNIEFSKLYEIYKMLFSCYIKKLIKEV